MGRIPGGSVVIACAMLKAEMTQVMARADLALPVCWVQEKLHEHPNLLRKELQRLLDQHSAAPLILLAFNWCGGALDGLRPGASTVVVPRFHDCIRMLCAPTGRPPAADTMYFTGGWVESDGFLSRECGRFAARRGEAKAHRVYRRMLREYRALTMVDTPAVYPHQTKNWEELRGFALRMGLAAERRPGSLRVLEKLVAGQWDEDFVVVPPHTAFTFDAFL